MHQFRNARKSLSSDKKKTVILSAFIWLPIGYYVISRAALPSALLGLVSAVFLISALADSQTGKIPNSFMITAATLSVLLQVSVNGIVGGLIRSIAVAILWTVIALLWYSRKKIGGGDLKMIGVTWLVFAAFPIGTALYLMFIWAIAVSTLDLVSMVRARKARHQFRAGPLLAACAISAWAIGLLISLH